MTFPAPLISVIIPTYCRSVSLRRCIRSLASQQYPRELFEIIAVDDGGNPPATAVLPTELNRNVHLVLLRQVHQGAAAARATGIEHARGKILAFLDDDCTVPPDYLSTIDEVFETHPETQVVQVGLDNAEPDNLYGQAWKFALEETLKVNLHCTQDGRISCGILGGVMVARRDVFTDVAYDVALRRSREDADLRYQLQARNLPVYYEPRIRVFHHYRQTLWSYLAVFFEYGRGQFHLQRKWDATPSPFRYVSLTSWKAFRSLVGAEEIPRSLAVYCLLWLKRHAGLCGLLYETAAWEFPRHWVPRWIRFGRLLGTTYARRTVWLCLAVFRRGVAKLYLFGGSNR